MRNLAMIPASRTTPQWDQLSDLAKTCIACGLTADMMDTLARIMGEAAAELRRAGLSGEMAHA